MRMTTEKLVEIFGEGTEEVEEVTDWPIAVHMDQGEVIRLAREYEHKTGKRLDRPTKKE